MKMQHWKSKKPVIQIKQALEESTAQKNLSNRDNRICYVDGEGRGHKLLFAMKTSLCSSPCTNFIPMVTINHIIYLNWKPMPSFMQSCHGLLLPCQQRFVLAFLESGILEQIIQFIYS